MPSNILSADTGFPTFTDGQSTETKINIIQNYLYMLLEQLRYSMSNLGASNFNDAELQGIANTIREPILAQLKDIDGNLTQLQITAEGLTSTVSDMQGNVSQLQQTAQGLTSTVTDMQGNVSELQQTAKGLTSTVSDMQGNIARVEEYAKGIRLSVTNGDTSSRITLTANGAEISSANILFNGVVTFMNGCANGTTQINGGCISTGKVKSQYLELSGAITWSDLTATTQNKISGFADDMAKAIADGQYSGGTFISGKGIYSPTIYANNLRIHTEDDDTDGFFTLMGTWGREVLEMLRLRYYRGDAPFIQFTSPARAIASWSFMETYVSGSVTFNDAVSFKGSVSGISTASVKLEQQSDQAQGDSPAESPSIDGQTRQADPPQSLTLYDAGGGLGVQLASGTRWLLGEEGWVKQ